VADDAYDEDRERSGVLRPGYAETLAALEGCDLDGLSRAVARRLESRGVSFGDDPFVVDAVPRLIPGAEWDALVEGLAQRARALNIFLRDAYGEREIVRAGVLPAETIEQAQGYEPDLLGCLPQRGAPAPVIGFDLVRDRDGAFLVLEDNLRTPSGFAYAVAARRALDDELPPGVPPSRPIEPVTWAMLESALRAAAPAGGGEPAIMVLTDGPQSVAYFEHEQISRRLQVVVGTLGDLVDEGERMGVRMPDGTTRPVDVVYRRTDEDRIRDDDGKLTDIARVLLEPWLDGRIGLVNGFGNGLADDKLLFGLVEDCIRFYLEEEPLVRSVPTRAIDGRPDVGELRELVVKPRNGYGGNGVVIGAHADARDLERLSSEIESDAERFIAQPLVALSRHPTIIDGRLEPRHVDLRAFAFCGDSVVGILPGGLTRVAFEAGTLVVNSSQHGGGKDTRVLAAEPRRR
jgi:uncharacterized circularly permuted ATP-grasp superfamily protein